MNPSHAEHDVSQELEDALARIDRAENNCVSLDVEMNEFLYNDVKDMVKEFDPKTENW